jgi:hypothetical protein
VATNSYEKQKKLLKEGLGPLSLFVSFLLLVLQVVQTILKVGAVFSEHRLLTSTVFLIAVGLILIAWRRLRQNPQFMTRKMRFWIFVAASLLYLIVVLYPYAKMWWLDRGPAPNPGTGLTSSFPLEISSAYGAQPLFEIIQFYPDDQLSSFEEVLEPDFAKGEGFIRTISYNHRVETARKAGRCTGVDGERPIKAVLPLLAERLDRLGRTDLRPYVRDTAGYRQMMSRGGSSFLDVTFTQVELSRMRTADPAGFSAVANWLVKCIGVRHPVITVVLRNNSTSRIVLSEVRYLVEKAFVTLGASAAAVTPVQVYDHVLPHTEGEHSQRLNPPFMLEAGAVGAFNLVLRPETEGPGLAWTMRLAVSDTDGNIAVTDRFQLIMTKAPE